MLAHTCRNIIFINMLRRVRVGRTLHLLAAAVCSGRLFQILYTAFVITCISMKILLNGVNLSSTNCCGNVVRMSEASSTLLLPFLQQFAVMSCRRLCFVETD